MGIVLVSSTSTDAGRVVATAAVAALSLAHGRRVAVVKPAQTGVLPGEPGDLAEVERLAPRVAAFEYARYAPALSPEAAARYAGERPARLTAVAKSVAALDGEFDLVLVDGVGGLLERYGPDGWTVAELAWSMQAPVLLTTGTGRDAPSHTALTIEALKARGVRLAGLVLTGWTENPGLVARSNVVDLETITGRPLDGVLPADPGDDFLAVARAGLDASWGGTFDAVAFRRCTDPRPAGTSITN